MIIQVLRMACADAHAAINVIVCVLAAAFGAIIWFQRSGSPIAPLLVLLLLDTFTWNFADLARSITGVETWHYADRFFSTLMPPLVMQIVIRFTGRERSMRKWIVTTYASFLVLALVQPRGTWWFYLFCASCILMATAIVLLWRHHRRHINRQERERTELIAIAIAVATLLGATDLWRNEVPDSTPPLANVGMLGAIFMVWVAVRRSNLLGTPLPSGLLLFGGAAFGVVLVAIYLTGVHFLDPHHGLLSAIVLSVLVLSFAFWREWSRQRVSSQKRARQLSMLGRLSEQLAHDLRNPLTALKGALQFLTLESQSGRSLDEHAKFLDLMLEQVHRVERTICNYQRLARVEPDFRVESLNDIVEAVVSLQRFGLTPHVTLTLQLSPRKLQCNADADLLALALENILRNACEAMPHGGELTIETNVIDQSPPILTLAVQDSGEGMDARTLEHAVDDFYTTKPQGTGLGLSFVRRVALAHSGDLRIDSQTGVGTKVVLCLPSIVSP